MKTIPREEFKFVKRMLKNYHDYVTIKNAESFMCRVYGLHKVIFYRKKGATEIYQPMVAAKAGGEAASRRRKRRGQTAAIKNS